MLTTITVIVIIGSLIAIFNESLPFGRFWLIVKKVVLFAPIVLIGTIMYIFSDFKNSKLGYIVIFLIIAFLGWGMYMGLKSGPESPPWD